MADKRAQNPAERLPKSRRRQRGAGGEAPESAETPGENVPPLAAPGPVDAFGDYWQLRMEGAANRLLAAKAIISHTGTTGSLAENLLRELVAEFLPRRWAVGTGFILNRDRQVSKQVDLLVYDVMTESPVYRDGDLVALAPGTAKIAVEVKSALDSEGIPGSLDNIRSVKELDPKVQGMVFGYGGVAAPTFIEHLRDWLGGNAPAKAARALPIRVYNLDQAFLAMDEKPDRGAVVDGTTYWVMQSPVPVTRFFLTELLARLNVDNLRDFLPAETLGDELGTA